MRRDRFCYRSTWIDVWFDFLGHYFHLIFSFVRICVCACVCVWEGERDNMKKSCTEFDVRWYIHMCIHCYRFRIAHINLMSGYYMTSESRLSVVFFPSSRRFNDLRDGCDVDFAASHVPLPNKSKIWNWPSSRYRWQPLMVTTAINAILSLSVFVFPLPLLQLRIELFRFKVIYIWYFMWYCIATTVLLLTSSISIFCVCVSSISFAMCNTSYLYTLYPGFFPTSPQMLNLSSFYFCNFISFLLVFHLISFSLLFPFLQPFYA